jgi:hypothetical protein
MIRLKRQSGVSEVTLHMESLPAYLETSRSNK